MTVGETETDYDPEWLLWQPEGPRDMTYDSRARYTDRTEPLLAMSIGVKEDLTGLHLAILVDPIHPGFFAFDDSVRPTREEIRESCIRWLKAKRDKGILNETIQSAGRSGNRPSAYSTAHEKWHGRRIQRYMTLMQEGGQSVDCDDIPRVQRRGVTPSELRTASDTSGDTAQKFDVHPQWRRSREPTHRLPAGRLAVSGTGSVVISDHRAYTKEENRFREAIAQWPKKLSQRTDFYASIRMGAVWVKESRPPIAGGTRGS